MGVACVTLRLYLRKGRYMGHLQWEFIRKSPTAWAKSYGAVVLGMGDAIYARYGKKFTETACPTRGPWFGNFVIGSKLWMELNKEAGIWSDQ